MHADAAIQYKCNHIPAMIRSTFTQPDLQARAHRDGRFHAGASKPALDWRVRILQLSSGIENDFRVFPDERTDRAISLHYVLP